jgi:hypothetical protein
LSLLSSVFPYLDYFALAVEHFQCTVTSILLFIRWSHSNMYYHLFVCWFFLIRLFTPHVIT